MSFDKSDVKQAAHGRWQSIFNQLGVLVETTKHTPCPACGGKDRFRYDDKHGNGNYICGQCGAGDGFSLLMKVHNWSFDETLTFVAGVMGFLLDGNHKPIPARMNTIKTRPSFTASSPNPYAVREIQRIRNTAIADTGRVQRYYLHRGLSCALSVSYNQFLESEKEPESGNFYPCSVYPIRAASGDVMGYQKIFLDDKLNGKAPVPQPKRMTQKLYDGAFTGCSVWLGKPDGRLLIVEGVETGLAVMQTTGKAVWAALTSSMMKNTIVPSCVRVVEIWADNDENSTGQDAAQILCDRLKSEGKICCVVLPPTTGDWLDVLNSGKVQVV